jgi:hypothetical protein
MCSKRFDMVNEAFLAICRVIGWNGDTPAGHCATPEDAVRVMRANPDFLQRERALLEAAWRGSDRTRAEALIELFVAVARYLSDVVQGDVPILVSRSEVEASTGLIRSLDAEALSLGKAVQRAIRAGVREQAHEANDLLLAEIQKIVAGAPSRTPAPVGRLLGTEDMAACLNLSLKTVQKLCVRGEIDADKTAGGQWRTTEKRLRQSPYLDGKKRKGRAGAALE